MKRQLKRIFKKLGFNTERITKVGKLPHPEQFYELYPHLNTTAEKASLKEYTKNLRLTDNQPFYEELLKRYVPEWDLDIREAEFVGKGLGEESLNTYRRIVTGKGEILFEKVFFTESRLVEKLKFLQEKISPEFEEKINSPKIQISFAGEELTIVYFEYFILNPVPIKQRTQEAFKIFNILKDIQPQPDWADEMNRLGINDFKDHQRYKWNLKGNLDLYKEENIDYSYFDECADNSVKVMAHGDLSKNNLFQGNRVVDWDYFEFYPIGFELAFIYRNSYLNDPDNRVGPLDLITTYLNKESTLNKEEVKRDFMYFSSIFSFEFFIRKGRHRNKRLNEIEQEIIHYLKYKGRSTKQGGDNLNYLPGA